MEGPHPFLCWAGWRVGDPFVALWDWPRGLEVFLFSFNVGFLWHVSTSLTQPELPIDGFCLLSAPPGGAAGPVGPTTACRGMHRACQGCRGCTG